MSVTTAEKLRPPAPATCNMRQFTVMQCQQAAIPWWSFTVYNTAPADVLTPNNLVLAEGVNHCGNVALQQVTMAKLPSLQDNTNCPAMTTQSTRKRIAV